MIQRDYDRLLGVHPHLVGKIEKILAAMEALSFPMSVTDGVRTKEKQFSLYQQGRTLQNGVWVKTGDTVTNCDGTVKRSNHQPHDDGFGHAIDCAFVVDLDEDGQTDANEPLTWEAKRKWSLYGAMAESLELHWGGRWTSPFDQPHVELP